MIILAVSDVFNFGYKQFRAVPPQELSLTPLVYPILPPSRC